MSESVAKKTAGLDASSVREDSENNNRKLFILLTKKDGTVSIIDRENPHKGVDVYLDRGGDITVKSVGHSQLRLVDTDTVRVVD